MIFTEFIHQREGNWRARLLNSGGRSLRQQRDGNIDTEIGVMAGVKCPGKWEHTALPQKTLCSVTEQVLGPVG